MFVVSDYLLSSCLSRRSTPPTQQINVRQVISVDEAVRQFQRQRFTAFYSVFSFLFREFSERCETITSGCWQLLLVVLGGVGQGKAAKHAQQAAFNKSFGKGVKLAVLIIASA